MTGVTVFTVWHLGRSCRHTHSITHLHSHSEIMTRLGAVLLQPAFMQSKQTKRGQFPMGELPKNHNKACNNLHIHKHYQQTPTYTHSHLLAHSCTPAHTHTYTFSPVHTHTHTMNAFGQHPVNCALFRSYHRSFNQTTEVSTKLCSGGGFQVHKPNQETVLLAANRP